MKKLWQFFYRIHQQVLRLEFIAPLLMRLYLVPVFWMAGTQKLFNIDNTASWFGNADWGLGLPFPYFMAYAAGSIELLGAILLALGLGVRFITPPLIAVMLVAVLSVHWENGWAVIADNQHAASIRLSEFLGWLKQTHPARHGLLTELKPLVILNNGIEFGVTYLIMLLSLFFTGAGKYLSLDYWLQKWWTHMSKQDLEDSPTS